MSLDVHFDDIARFGTRKRRKGRATLRTVFRCVTQVMHFDHHRQGGAITAPMPLHARLLPPMARTGRRGLTGRFGTGRFLALGPVEALVQVAHLSFKHFDLGLQGRFALHQARVLGPPVVRLPLEPDIVLLRQHHYLLGKGRGALAVDRCKLRGGDGLWVSTFHELCYTSFFWKVPFFLMGRWEWWGARIFTNDSQQAYGPMLLDTAHVLLDWTSITHHPAQEAWPRGPLQCH